MLQLQPFMALVPQEGVIVVTTKRGAEGKMRLNYSTNFSLTTSPSRSVDLMNSREKLQWEQELWDEFSQAKFAKRDLSRHWCSGNDTLWLWKICRFNS